MAKKKAKIQKKAATNSSKNKSTQGMTYADSGVNIEAGDTMVGMIQKCMRKTYGPRVIGQHGAFAGLFRLDYNEKLFKRNYKDPVLVACTDGVGTKVKLAGQMGIYDTVGQDLVAMSINDLIVQGAEPLFFLDYLAVNKLDPQLATDMVKGVSDGCVLGGCALLGGETAEMPDVYSEGDFDMAGFAVGVVELSKVIDGKRVEEGDVILGLSSSGIHSNGYSLVRKIVDHHKLKLTDTVDFTKYLNAKGKSKQNEHEKALYERPLGEVLLEPTRIYARPIVSLQRRYKVKQPTTAMAHITGGGLPGNVNRVLPSHLNARIKKGSWDIPPIFKFLQEKGNVSEEEMYKVFNMGIGYVLIVRPHFADSVRDQLRRKGEDVRVIGKVVKGTGKVQLRK